VGYLEGLLVKADARGQGVARLLVDAVRECAAELGYVELAAAQTKECQVSQNPLSWPPMIPNSPNPRSH